MRRLCLGLLFCVSCGRTSGEPTGRDGGPCYPNRSCDAGFVCAEGVCVSEAVLACEAVTCSGHGTCSLSEGEPFCVCDPGYRPIGLACIDVAGCVPTTHAMSWCDGGDVYWFDGCGEREELRYDCAGEGCSGNRCLGDVLNMVLITDFPQGAFWIDVYEASLTGPGELGDLDQDADNDGKIADAEAAAAHATSHFLSFDDDGGDDSTVITSRQAASVRGVRPVNLSFYQALGACARAGKRLCTDSEWLWACQGGSAANAFPYGSTYDGGDNMGEDCWSNYLAPVQPTGIASGCVTSNGIFDLSGNVAEWAGFVSTSAGHVLGGDVGEEGGLVSCTSTQQFEPFNTATWVGFRCCRDP